MPLRPFAATLALLLCSPALAQAPASAPASLVLELNALQPAEAGCRVTFLATNRLGGRLDRAAVELALFDAAGTIDRIVTLDFKDLSVDKTKVLQFELAGLQCDGLGRLLVNDITACEGAISPPTICLDALETSTRLDVDFGV
ncbi:MAG: hypothetical protein KJ944_11175 [Alphaproteobacteria bacterium]|nr:hypothetical protein [Alphaproteobacteria bacterium]MBU1562871.1 hypothetical protein [Alphaproteobacteria bacterium]MBU2303149.1 hypothetical protein [Alphaproteobacteria bacterium]MBU2368448.1 hypothetical protein [Alphaproteobacteria bacterium]